MKKIIIVLLILSMLPLSLFSCSFLEGEAIMWRVTPYHAFENDTWLVIDSMLINKENGTVALLDADHDATIPEYGNQEIFYHGPYAYRYEFGESSFKEYTFLEFISPAVFGRLYYECVFTYDYEGKEIERAYIGEPLTKEEMKAAYKTNPSATDAYSFVVREGGLGFSHKKFVTDAEEQADPILTFAKNLYTVEESSYIEVLGLAKTVGDEIWFATTATNRRDSVKAMPIMNGIYHAEVIAYTPETGEYRTVYEFDKERKRIIDFDERGMYLLDMKYTLSYFDFASEKTTPIHTFSTLPSYFAITDDYICASYIENGRTYFVYQKGGEIIAYG